MAILLMLLLTTALVFFTTPNIRAQPTSVSSSARLQTRQTTAEIVSYIGPWQYKGCYKDNGSTRLLTFRFDIPQGNTAERCTTTCQNQGYSLAGLEYGQECWCDNYMPFEPDTILAPDAECNTPCPGNPAELCGAGNRLVVYQNSIGTPPSPSKCITWRGGYWNGKMRAVKKNVNNAVVTELPVPLWSVYTNPVVDTVSYQIISGCPNGSCSSGENYWMVWNNALLGPWSSAAIKPSIGESQAFIKTSINQPLPYAGYCLKPNAQSPHGPFIGYPLLSIDGYTDRWAFCTNATADNRLDMVYSPIVNHAHYDKDSCVPVDIQVMN